MASEIILVGPTGQQQGGLDEYEFTVTRGSEQQRNLTETTKTLARKMNRNSLDQTWQIHKIPFLKLVDDQDPEIVTLQDSVRRLSNRISEFQTMLNFITGGDD